MTARAFFILLFTAMAWAAWSYPPPEKKGMTIGEIESRMYDLDGKVVEIEFTYANNLTQTGPGEYRVYLSYWEVGDSYSSRTVYFSGEEAREFFEEAVEDSAGGWSSIREEVYVLVDGSTLRAVGTRYQKRKEEYSW